MNAIDRIYESVKARDPDQPEFHQAVLEVLESLGPVLEKHPEYISIAERVVEPERLIHSPEFLGLMMKETYKSTEDSEFNSMEQLVHTKVDQDSTQALTHRS